MSYYDPVTYGILFDQTAESETGKGSAETKKARRSRAYGK